MRCTRGHAPFLSFRWTFELSLTGWGEKKKGWVTAHPSFFSLPFADDVCRSTTLENRRLFSRSFPWIRHTHTLPRLRPPPPPTSGFRARKFRNLFYALFLLFLVFVFFRIHGLSNLFDLNASRQSDNRMQTQISVKQNQKHGKRRYVPRYEQRFILHILHVWTTCNSFLTRYATEVSKSLVERHLSIRSCQRAWRRLWLVGSDDGEKVVGRG